jgi:hypothetical protein
MSLEYSDDPKLNNYLKDILDKLKQPKTNKEVEFKVFLD